MIKERPHALALGLYNKILGTNGLETITKADECLANFESHQEMMVKPKPKKTRRCLRCGVNFISTNFGNRVCANCEQINARKSWRAEHSIEV